MVLGCAERTHRYSSKQTKSRGRTPGRVGVSAVAAVLSRGRLLVLVEVSFFPLQTLAVVEFPGPLFPELPYFSGKGDEGLLNVDVLFAAALEEGDVETLRHLVGALLLDLPHIRGVAFVAHQDLDHFWRRIL